MHVIVAYDISSARQRTRVFKLLEERGIHSQRSVFECFLPADETAQLLELLREHIDPGKDSLLIFPLCRRCSGETAVLGQGIPLLQSGWTCL